MDRQKQVELILDFDALRLKAEKLKGVEESCLDIIESSVPATIQIDSRIMFAILLDCGDKEFVLRVSGRVEDVAYAVDSGRDKIYAKLTDVWPCGFFNPFLNASVEPMLERLGVLESGVQELFPED